MSDIEAALAWKARHDELALAIREAMRLLVGNRPVAARLYLDMAINPSLHRE